MYVKGAVQGKAGFPSLDFLNEEVKWYEIRQLGSATRLFSFCSPHIFIIYTYP